jgi:hypothetical protein
MQKLHEFTWKVEIPRNRYRMQRRAFIFTTFTITNTMKAIIIILLSLLSIALQAQDTVQYRINFACNSASIDYLTTEEIDFLSDVTIISIEGYASVEGSSEGNRALSTNRALAVSGLLNSDLAVGKGATSKFGNKRGANRVVVVTYVTATVTTSTINAEGIVVETPTPSNIEGFNCGNVVNPSIYFEDTLQVEEPVMIPATIVVEPIILTPNAGQVALSVTPFLPTRQAVRFQMREHGMSREAAIKSIEARKPQWKELKPSKPKAKKVSMKRTRGANRSLFVRLFPFAGC